MRQETETGKLEFFSLNNCEHEELECIETIDYERDFYGQKYLVLYRCVNCNQEIQEWTREK